MNLPVVVLKDYRSHFKLLQSISEVVISHNNDRHKANQNLDPCWILYLYLLGNAWRLLYVFRSLNYWEVVLNTLVELWSRGVWGTVPQNMQCLFDNCVLKTQLESIQFLKRTDQSARLSYICSKGYGGCNPS